MNSRIRGRLLLVFGMIVAALSSPASTPRVGSTRQAVLRLALCRRATQIPDWDVDKIRSCADGCTASNDFNVCFTCSCLKQGAETPGELVSAIAQCQQASGL
jgi:hypothetical protein